MLSATIEYRTGLAEGDLKRIAAQAKTLAMHLNLDEIACRNIYLSALIHDIGAVGLNDRALEDHLTPGLFTHKNIADHPVIGATIIGRIKRMAALTENIRHQSPLVRLKDVRLARQPALDMNHAFREEIYRFLCGRLVKIAVARIAEWIVPGERPNIIRQPGRTVLLLGFRLPCCQP